jgi:hypothetical protein
MRLSTMSMHNFTAMLKSEQYENRAKCSLWYQHKNTIFPLSLRCTGLWVSNFCWYSGSPDGRDVQAGFTEWMVYQRQVDVFLVFPVCGVWFNVHQFIGQI